MLHWESYRSVSSCPDYQLLEFFSGVCHPRSLLCHTRSKVLSLGQHLKHTFPYSLKIGRVQQQNTCVFSGWTGSGLKSGNVLTNEGVKDAWRQILTDLRRGDNSFSQIGRDFLTISRPSCLFAIHFLRSVLTLSCSHQQKHANTKNEEQIQVQFSH